MAGGRAGAEGCAGFVIRELVAGFFGVGMKHSFGSNFGTGLKKGEVLTNLDDKRKVKIGAQEEDKKMKKKRKLDNVYFRPTAEMLEWIDRIARESGDTRSAVIRRLVNEALKARGYERVALFA